MKPLIAANWKMNPVSQVEAKSIFDAYLTEFGDINLEDPDLFDNIADLICEKKKLSKTTISEIKTNIEHNMKLIYLDINHLPIEVKRRMDNVFSK